MLFKNKQIRGGNEGECFGNKCTNEGKCMGETRGNEGERVRNIPCG